MKKLIASSILASATLSCQASTIAFNFFHGDFATPTGIGSGENTAALNTIANLVTPVWTNIPIAGAGSTLNGRGTGSNAGVNVSAFSANSWAAGAENLGAGSDASQQVFRIYLDDGDGGNGYFNGDGIGGSIHLTGIQTFLNAQSAVSYTVSVFYTSDNANNNFPGANIYSGIPGAASATAITSLPLLGSTSSVLLGGGDQPLPSAGGTTTGSRGWGELAGLTADNIVIAMPLATGRRESIAGFAITAVVPEPSAVTMLGFASSLLLVRRRRA